MEQKKLSDLVNKVALNVKKAKKAKQTKIELDVDSAQLFATATTVLGRIMKLSEAASPSPGVRGDTSADAVWSIIAQELDRLGE
jgi:hypothetical protein